MNHYESAVKRHLLAQDEMRAYINSEDIHSNPAIKSITCPTCGPVQQSAYWEGRCYKCIQRECSEAFASLYAAEINSGISMEGIMAIWRKVREEIEKEKEAVR